MCEGEKRRMLVPASQAYGSKGLQPSIPADADLIFIVELTKIERTSREGGDL